jgi:c-di-GMP-binding flagellar brake protein YcgR
MKPRRILTAHETIEILDQAVRENALAVLCTPLGAGWRTFKSHFLERDPKRQFVVLDYRETHGVSPPALATGQYVGVSFRHKSRKMMFGTVAEAKGRFVLGANESVSAIRYRWPDGLTELQRRAYQRTRVPDGARLMVNVWSGGVGQCGEAQTAHGAILSGDASDVSCGGVLVRLSRAAVPTWGEDATLGIELHLPDGRPPVRVNGFYRGSRYDRDSALCLAVQFVGLELTPDGKSILQRLARCVQKFHRHGLAQDLKGEASASRRNAS